MGLLQWDVLNNIYCMSLIFHTTVCQEKEHLVHSQALNEKSKSFYKELSVDGNVTILYRLFISSVA